MGVTPGDKCWCCGDWADELHHIKPARYGGTYAADNVLPLCVACHDVVDCMGQPVKWMLERIVSFPRIQVLITARVMADNAAIRVMKSLERETVRQAIRVAGAPHDLEIFTHLLGCVRGLKKSYEANDVDPQAMLDCQPPIPMQMPSGGLVAPPVLPKKKREKVKPVKASDLPDDQVVLVFGRKRKRKAAYPDPKPPTPLRYNLGEAWSDPGPGNRHTGWPVLPV